MLYIWQTYCNLTFLSMEKTGEKEFKLGIDHKIGATTFYK